MLFIPNSALDNDTQSTAQQPTATFLPSSGKAASTKNHTKSSETLLKSYLMGCICGFYDL